MSENNDWWNTKEGTEQKARDDSSKGFSLDLTNVSAATRETYQVTQHFEQQKKSNG